MFWDKSRKNIVIKYDLRAEITEALQPVYANLNALESKTDNLNARLVTVENNYNVDDARILYWKPSFEN